MFRRIFVLAVVLTLSLASASCKTGGKAVAPEQAPPAEEIAAVEEAPPAEEAAPEAKDECPCKKCKEHTCTADCGDECPCKQCKAKQGEKHCLCDKCKDHTCTAECGDDCPCKLWKAIVDTAGEDAGCPEKVCHEKCMNGEQGELCDACKALVEKMEAEHGCKGDCGEECPCKKCKEHTCTAECGDECPCKQCKAKHGGHGCKGDCAGKGEGEGGCRKGEDKPAGCPHAKGAE